ncbi:ATP-binding protein [Bradyrhizobium sp. BRP22]|uniref:ATP-binding protein n=1 Tax=Bradyrhizobium sp. BRP22 TaxID=2793821 RepID=UPI0031FDDE16
MHLQAPQESWVPPIWGQGPIYTVIFLCAADAWRKTHLAGALWREAILAGHSVQFVAAPTIVAQLAKGRSERRLEERLAQFGKPKLLITDELGYLPFEPNAPHLYFQLVSRCYERGAIRLTSNRSIVEWDSVFRDPVVVTAIRSPVTPRRRDHNPRRLIDAGEQASTLRTTL